MNERLIGWLGRGAVVGLALIGVLVGWYWVSHRTPAIKPERVVVTFRSSNKSVLKQTTVTSAAVVRQVYQDVMSIPAPVPGKEKWSCPGTPGGKGFVSLLFFSPNGKKIFTATLFPAECPVTLKLPDGQERYDSSEQFRTMEALVARILNLSVVQMRKLA